MIKQTMMIFLMVMAAFTSVPASAQDDEVIIRNDGDKTIYEYKVNGKIKEIKVVPKVGKPYYLVPDDADESDLNKTQESKIKAPWWVIFRW